MHSEPSLDMADLRCPQYVDGRRSGSTKHWRPALFLDRDGVINADQGYTHRQESFEFLPGIFELARRASRSGRALVVVTNQAGIGRGHYGEATFRSLTAWMIERFADEGAAIERVYFCPHHPEAQPGPYRRECTCRKPAAGMILAACADLGLDAASSMLVGDKASDLQAGARAGVGTLMLVGSDPAAEVQTQVLRSPTVAQAAELLFPRRP